MPCQLAHSASMGDRGRTYRNVLEFWQRRSFRLSAFHSLFGIEANLDRFGAGVISILQQLTEDCNRVPSAC
jgi:hypothetical protein